MFNRVYSTQRVEEYKRVYDRLIERGRNREYSRGVHHRHHIVPKSMGGSNIRSNISVLTYREHFLVHWLLSRITTGEDRYKMLDAINRMMGRQKDHPTTTFTGWQYAIAHKANSEARSQRMIGNNHAKGAKHSKEANSVKSGSMIGNQRAKGYQHTNDAKTRISVSLFGHKRNLGRKQSEEEKLKRGLSNIGKHSSGKRIRCLTDRRVFPSMKIASRYYRIPSYYITQICNGSKLSHKGLSFEFVSKVEIL